MTRNFNELKKNKNMTPTEFLQDRNIITKDKTDLIIGFNNCTKESLIDLLEKYHQAKLKLLGIADVINLRELLLDFADYSERDKTSQATDECVDDYLDSIK